LGLYRPWQAEREAEQQQVQKVQKAIHVRCFPIIPTQYCRAALSLAAKAVMLGV
jgi:hypothetical protein